MSLPVELQQDEVVVALLRRHPVYVIIKTIFVGVVTLAVAAFFLWLGSLSGTGVNPFSLVLVVITLALGLGYLAVILYRYWNDVWLITNQRLVDSTKMHPFDHRVSSTDLVNIQDLSISKQGVLATLFNFGDVLCHTASNTKAFSFVGVPDPNRVLDIIDEYRDAARLRVSQSASL
ncbi:MAG: PH domain-containing protein [Chloroflexi bacterium]|nr:PH domain-containing protein [Chloroflexota bacterium]